MTDQEQTGVSAGTQAGEMRSSEIRAARLRAIKSDIAENLRQAGLSIHALASRHAISVGYIRQLFAGEGTTFEDFILQQRLAIAYLMLGEARFSDHTINAIALEVGFGDVDRFSRAFRRRYGVKPSDIRARTESDPIETESRVTPRSRARRSAPRRT